MSLSVEYSKINPNESACDTRKKYAPFKCAFVPADYLKIIITKYPKLCEFVFWTCFLEWMRDTRKRPTVSQLNAARKKW